MRACVICGKELVPKRRKNGRKEQTCHFEVRKTCGNLCAGVFKRNYPNSVSRRARTPEQLAREESILRDREVGQMPYSAIAEKYGYKESTARSIVNRLRMDKREV